MVTAVEADARPAAGRPASIPVLATVAAYGQAARSARAAGARVGVVPTMGALHAGHRALIERAAHECDMVVVTLFVNPTQFGETSDLDHYPRPFEADLDVAAAAGASFVFAPSDAEMYPEGLRSDALPADLADLAGRLEGASRPGHFAGVATVVPRLLAPAGPCHAYFGEKDFQQLA
ncbi:MAG: pantoate--beta-alanine ligase, partial [Acidimicrobiales bacterium]|nr:pantoate--beta-alanine ligase [Acidimicrobiales bacterium]